MNELVASKIDMINALHDKIAEAMRRSLEDALHIGVLLLEAKDVLEQGSFVGWIEKECHFSVKTAYRYMQLARHREEVIQATNLQEAYRLADHYDKEDRDAEERRRMDLIAMREKTGEKPEGWDRGCDYLMHRMEEAAPEPPAPPAPEPPASVLRPQFTLIKPDIAPRSEVAPAFDAIEWILERCPDDMARMECLRDLVRYAERRIHEIRSGNVMIQ